MLSEKELRKIAQKQLEKYSRESSIKYAVLEEFTIQKPYGLIFFYNSQKYLETKDDKYDVAGNAPFLVESKTGKIIEFGTNRSEEYFIKEYEAGRWPQM